MRHLPKLVRFTCGVLVFAIVGPPAGGMVAWLGMGAPTMRSPLPFIAGAWLEGGALALGVGLLTGIAAWFGRASWLVPVAAAALLCAIFVLATAGPDWAIMLRVALVFTPPALAAAIACWLLTRRLFEN